MWEAGAEGVVGSDSPSRRAYTGQTLGEWIGYDWMNTIHPGDRVDAERQWREAKAAHRVVDADFRLRAPHGGWRWTNFRAVPVLDAKGKIATWAGTIFLIPISPGFSSRSAIGFRRCGRPAECPLPPLVPLQHRLGYGIWQAARRLDQAERR